MRSLLLLAAATALLFALMAAYTAPLVPSIPVIQFTFTEASFTRVLDAWQAAGVARFRRHFAIDFPFLACYGALGYQLSMRTTLFHGFRPPARRLSAAALPGAAAADAVENVVHLYILAAVPHGPVPYLVAGTVASIKWLLIAAFVALAADGLRRKLRGSR